MTSQSPPSRDPETRDEVARLESALTLLCPGACVDSDHAGPESAWVQRITIPTRNNVKMTITNEIYGWQATIHGGQTTEGGWPLEHSRGRSLIEVIRDAVVCVLGTRDASPAV